MTAVKFQHNEDKSTLQKLGENIVFTLAPIWFPHWPTWMWTISRILMRFFLEKSRTVNQSDSYASRIRSPTTVVNCFVWALYIRSGRRLGAGPVGEPTSNVKIVQVCHIGLVNCLSFIALNRRLSDLKLNLWIEILWKYIKCCIKLFISDFSCQDFEKKNQGSWRYID